MKVSKELEDYFRVILKKAHDPKNGEDAAGWSNALLMTTRSYAMALAIEQTKATNFTSPLMEVLDGKGKSDSKN